MRKTAFAARHYIFSQRTIFRIFCSECYSYSSVLWGSTPVCSINYPSSPFIGSSKSPLRGREAFVGGWYRVGQHYTLTINQCSEKTASVSRGEENCVSGTKTRGRERTSISLPSHMTSSAARFVAVIVETSPLKDSKVTVKLSLRTALSHTEDWLYCCAHSQLRY